MKINTILKGFDHGSSTAILSENSNCDFTEAEVLDILKESRRVK